MTDEEQDAVRNYERLAKIAENARGKAANGAEANKGAAYKKLVRMGLRMKLKKKYCPWLCYNIFVPASGVQNKLLA